MGTDKEVACAIDKNVDAIYADIDVFSVEDRLVNVDAIVVTAITFFDEVEQMLKKKISCPILSLEDVLYEV